MRVLITGIGGPTPIGIAKSLRLKYDRDEVTIIGVDGDELAPGLYNNSLFDKTFLVPHARHEQYWEVIERLVENEKIDYAFIVPETEVLVWSHRQKEEKLPCKALIPDLDVAQILYDKYKTYDLLRDTDLVPRSQKLHSGTNLEEIGTDLGYPYWIRGGSGAGAIGAYKIESIVDLRNWININPNIDDFLASVFLPGRNYACKMLFWDGKLIRSASGERVDYLLPHAAPSGISGMCSRGRLINDKGLVEKSEAAIQKIHKILKIPAHGMFTVDFKEDNDGEAKITEINIRHVSFTYAFSLAGANFAVDTLRLPNNLPNVNHMMYEFEHDLTFIRGVDSELFILKDSDIKDRYPSA